MNFQKQVKRFHEMMGHPVGREGPFKALPAEEIKLRVRLMQEELNEELVPAMLAEIEGNHNVIPNRVLIADGLADLMYVVYGTAVVYDIPLDEIMRIICRSNETKTPQAGVRGVGEKYAAVLPSPKGPNYVAPEHDIEKALRLRSFERAQPRRRLK